MELHSERLKGIVIKLIFFVSFAGFSSWLSYFNVYLKEVPHLSSFEIGAIAAIQQISTIVVAPLWGMLADRFGRRNVMAVALLLSSAFLYLFLIDTQFVYYVLFILIVTSVFNTLPSLLDSIGLDFQEESGKVSFGEIRLWGSLGWALSSVATGYIINAGGIGIIFPLASGILVLAALLTIFIYKPLKTQSGLKSLKLNQISALLKEEGELLRFFLFILLFALLAAPTSLFINMYYNEIGSSSSQIGLAYAAQAMSELPFFFYGKRILQRFGTQKVFVASVLFTASRLFLYGINSSPWLAIAIGSTQGLGLALFIVSVTEYVHSIVPAQFRSTGQSLFYTFYSAGICLGNLLAGWLKDEISLQKTMLLNSLLLLILSLLYIGLQKRRNQRLKQV